MFKEHLKHESVYLSTFLAQLHIKLLKTVVRKTIAGGDWCAVSLIGTENMEIWCLH